MRPPLGRPIKAYCMCLAESCATLDRRAAASPCLFQEPNMSEVGNKAIYLRFAQAVNQRNLDALDPLVASDWINHGADPNEPPGAERFKRIFAELIAACPDFQITVEDQLTEGDKVMIRWRDTGTHTAGPLLGVPP